MACPCFHTNIMRFALVGYLWHLLILFMFVDLTRVDAEERKFVFLSIDDYRRADNLTAEQENPNDRDPLLFADLFEGDILKTKSLPGTSRSAIGNPNSQWQRGIVFYALSTDYDTDERTIIASAFNHIESVSCIRFLPRHFERDYLYLRKTGKGCFSSVGRLGGEQLVSLDDACIGKGTIAHELLHSLGFYHEQSRPDRDKYVEILYDNIQMNRFDQFQQYPWQEAHRYVMQLPYDYTSIMHYGEYYFSRNGKPTIRTIPQTEEIGQRKEMSEIDIRKLNTLYQCRRNPGGNQGNGGNNGNNFGGGGRNPQQNCQDTGGQRCIQALQGGYCRSNNGKIQRLVRQYCPRSCGFCTDSTNYGTGREKCEDTSEVVCARTLEYHLCERQEARVSCPKTCGYCGVTAAPDCKDSDKVICDRTKQYNLCGLPEAKSSCPKTCGYCGSGSGPDPKCTDADETICSRTKEYGLCSQPEAKSSCPKTCGYCGAGGGDPNCVDKADAAICEKTKKYDLCPQPEAKISCARTCGHCGSVQGRLGGSNGNSGGSNGNSGGSNGNSGGSNGNSGGSNGNSGGSNGNSGGSNGNSGGSNGNSGGSNGNSGGSNGNSGGSNGNSGGGNGCVDNAAAAICEQTIKYNLCPRPEAKTSCPKSCGYCGTSQGGSTGGSGCVDNAAAAICEQTVKYDLCPRPEAKTSCPKSCGYCGTSQGGSNCVDNAAAAICEQTLKYDLCSRPEAKTSCPKTCGYCGTSSGGSGGSVGSGGDPNCVDNAAAAICEQTLKYDLCPRPEAKTSCPKTCGYCGTSQGGSGGAAQGGSGGSTGNPNCVDKADAAVCDQTVKYDLCGMAEAKTICAKSCRFC